MLHQTIKFTSRVLAVLVVRKAVDAIDVVCSGFRIWGATYCHVILGFQKGGAWP